MRSGDLRGRLGRMERMAAAVAAARQRLRHAALGEWLRQQEAPPAVALFGGDPESLRLGREIGDRLRGLGRDGRLTHIPPDFEPGRPHGERAILWALKLDPELARLQDQLTRRVREHLSESAAPLGW